MSRFALLMTAAAIALLTPVRAHQELYHNVEVDLAETAETGLLSVYFTIHAPELLVGSEEAGDAMFDALWLGEQSETEIEEILKLARSFLGRNFELGFEGEPRVDIERRIRFEEPDRIRDAKRGEESGLPPACLMAFLQLKVMPKATRLRVANAPGSGKRLMLVVVRPKSFPEVVDLDTGEAVAITLPKVERQGEWSREVFGVVFGSMLGVAGILQAFRGRRLAKRVLVR